MKRRIICVLLCLMLFVSILAMPASAFDVSYYNEDVYAGGILDMMAFVGETDLSGYTFQWQFAGIGDDSWVNLDDNEYYKGTKTNHLQVHTLADREYTGWDEIPFRCSVTKNGQTKYTPRLYMYIHPYSSMEQALKNWDFGLYEPKVKNAADLTTNDYVTYTANAYAGTNLEISCGGNTATQKQILTNSEVELRREIRITENGKYVTAGDQTTYIPYTVGSNAVKIEVNMRIIMAGVDKGIYQTKTINLSTKKPDAIGTATAKSSCSLLRYPYNESEKLAAIPKGTTVEIVGQSGSYYQVCYNNRVGYVGASLLNVNTPVGDVTIKNIDVEIDRPVAGQTPASTCKIVTAGCALYKTDPVTWTHKDTGRLLEAGEKFQEGKSYVVSIWVAAKDGYKFQTDASYKPQLTGSINGNLPPFINKAYEQSPEEVVELTYTFNNTPKPQEPPEHVHIPSGWRTAGAYHYKVCTTCGDFLDQEDHRGGVAACNAKGKCTVCGYDYLETNENHTPDTKWTACGGLYHAKLCKLCGAHCTPEDHKPGPEATEDTPQTCTVCKYVIVPAKNHKHELTRVAETAPTCIGPGKAAHYSCSGCNQLFLEESARETVSEPELVIPAQGHKMSNDHGFDEQNHWYLCVVCKADMTDTCQAHQLQDGKCGICNYVIGSEMTRPTDTTEPTGNTTPQPTQKPQENTPKKNSWLLIALIALACFGVAVTASVIILKKKKENRHEENR